MDSAIAVWQFRSPAFDYFVYLWYVLLRCRVLETVFCSTNTNLLLDEQLDTVVSRFSELRTEPVLATVMIDPAIISLSSPSVIIILVNRTLPEYAHICSYSN